LQENQIPRAIFENKMKDPQINLLKKFHVNCSQFQGFANMVNHSILIATISNKCNPSWPCEHPIHMHIRGLILPSFQERFFFSLTIFKLFKQNLMRLFVATPLWAKCEGEAHTPKSGNLESSETPKNSELELKGQNTSNWGVLGVIGKVLKCRCLKWPRIGHLDICSPSYGQKKGREWNCQFDSRPLKVGNRPLPDVCNRSATRRWKALDESYKLGSKLVPIRVRGEKLWTPKVPGVQTGTVSGLLLRSPGKKKSFGCSLRAELKRIL
jgi:hypothetical protein